MKKKTEMCENVKELLESNTDPDGWYTGVPTTDAFDVPVQDADDL